MIYDSCILLLFNDCLVYPESIASVATAKAAAS